MLIIYLKSSYSGFMANKVPLFPLHLVYSSTALLGVNRAAKLAIWQILGFWWLNGCSTLPDDAILCEISCLRGREWWKNRDAIKTSLSKLMPVLEPIMRLRTKKAIQMRAQAFKANQAFLKANKLRRAKLAKMEGLTDKEEDTGRTFTALKPAARAFKEGMNDMAARGVALDNMASRTGPAIGFKDK